MRDRSFHRGRAEAHPVNVRRTRLRSAVAPMLVLALLLLGAGAGGGEPGLETALSGLVQNGGVLVADREAVLLRYGRQGPLVPASTLKLATALAAIHYLGKAYRHRTEVYLGPSGDLTIRGYGDPFLVSEEWAALCEGLQATGRVPREIRGLRLDPSAFAPDIQIPGVADSLESYHARNGALVANFNTLYVEVRPDGTVVSAEPQTPMTPTARRLAEGLPPGRHRVNVSRGREETLRYVGELARAFLERQGYTVSGEIRVGRVGEADRRVYTHWNTRTLAEGIQAMMLYSNNFVANQLLLTIGLEKGGEPATLEKGLALLERFLIERVGIPATDFRVVEGSGISRDNRLTPGALLALARAFYPYRYLLAVQEGRFLKTGTLSGVYDMAGCLSRDRPLFFAVMLNQPRNTRDRVFSLLVDAFGADPAAAPISPLPK